MLHALSGAVGHFYITFVHLPTSSTPLQPVIADSPKFMPFFKDCVGAIDGTHVPALVPAEDHGRYRNRKGFISQNILAACTMDLKIIYCMSGWEGSAADSRLWNDAVEHDLVLPEGKYFVADAGFANCDALLTPYRGTRYHLREWQAASLR